MQCLLKNGINVILFYEIFPFHWNNVDIFVQWCYSKYSTISYMKDVNLPWLANWCFYISTKTKKVDTVSKNFIWKLKSRTLLDHVRTIVRTFTKMKMTLRKSLSVPYSMNIRYCMYKTMHFQKNKIKKKISNVS